MNNTVIRLEEKTEHCPVTVVQASPMIAKNYSWQKDGAEIYSLDQDISVNDSTITFNDVKRENAGNYSLTSFIPCHKDSDSREFNGDLILDVICKYHGTLTYINVSLIVLKKKKREKEKLDDISPLGGRGVCLEIKQILIRSCSC